ncbi:MAG TPA: RdgB/HAM1 family non-canonical purine NTP pyrophosphatase [Flavipsychrobacter sp.]|nr:RdgB/HAM1 family non-canonical purine NTP pyrophosphatase [Flavipsychrobacter sp.]
MQELVVASRNAGKIREIEALIEGIRLLSLDDIGFTTETEEPYETFEENALTKAQAVYNYCGKNVLADDSGLCVPALNGAPGVHSAYFGGLPRSDEKNNQQLLAQLEGIADRSAFYKAVICLIWEGNPYFFVGICEGKIAAEPSGEGGFGYDPLFIPKGHEITFGQLPATVKNTLSHRGKAVQKMVAFLKDQVNAS